MIHYKVLINGQASTTKELITSTKPKKKKSKNRKPKPQKTICVYCGTALTAENRTIDHVIPLSLGGSNKARNKVAACITCNGLKGSKPLLVWLKELLNRLPD